MKKDANLKSTSSSEALACLPTKIIDNKLRPIEDAVLLLCFDWFEKCQFSELNKVLDYVLFLFYVIFPAVTPIIEWKLIKKSLK